MYSEEGVAIQEVMEHAQPTPAGENIEEDIQASCFKKESIDEVMEHAQPTPAGGHIEEDIQASCFKKESIDEVMEHAQPTPAGENIQEDIQASCSKKESIDEVMEHAQPTSAGENIQEDIQASCTKKESIDDKISDSDIRNITKLLGPADLKRFYYSSVFGLQSVEVERIEYDNHHDGIEVTARKVLKEWRKKEASEATRGKVLQALEESECMEARRKLEDNWSIKGLKLQVGPKWQAVKEFKREAHVGFTYASGITVATNGNIFVVDSSECAVYQFTADGNLIQALGTPDLIKKAQLNQPQDVASVPPRKEVIVVDKTNTVKVFEETGEYKRNFCSRNQKGLAVVSNHGHIFVLGNRKDISIHDHDGGITGKISLSYLLQPAFLAATSPTTIMEGIIISDYMTAKKALAIDITGKDLFSIDQWQVNGKLGAEPWGVTCDNEGYIYIGVGVEGGTEYLNNSHIHMYNNNGEFKECIAKKLYYPLGLAWFNGALYIANRNTVLVYANVSI